MTPEDFNNLIRLLFTRLGESLSTLANSAGVLDSFVIALDRGIVPFLSPRTLITRYEQIHILVYYLDHNANSLTVILDAIQDTINNYEGDISPELIDTFRNANNQVNDYVRRVQFFVQAFRNLENALLIRGFINDIAPDFLCESIHL